MIGARFSSSRKSEPAILVGNQNSQNYIETLHDHLPPIARAFHDDDFIFQQDNASTHASKASPEWLRWMGIPTLKWPAHSPDLSPIENLWEKLAREVYLGDRQFKRKEDLRKRVFEAWGNVSKDLQKKLVESMKSGYLKTIKQMEAKNSLLDPPRREHCSEGAVLQFPCF